MMSCFNAALDQRSEMCVNPLFLKAHIIKLLLLDNKGTGVQVCGNEPWFGDKAASV